MEEDIINLIGWKKKDRNKITLSNRRFYPSFRSPVAPAILVRNHYDIMVFYGGGVPKKIYSELLFPLLRSLKIDFLTFGRPMMFDVGKVVEIVEEVKMGTFFAKLQKILRCPEYLLFLSALPEK